MIKNNKEYFNKISKNIHYKNNRDLMDAELIHFAVVGQPNDDNTNDPVYCYTCDDYEKIKDRVLTYKHMIHIIEDDFKNFQKENPANLEINLDINSNLIMGIIAFCNPDTGEISKILDIKQIPGIEEDMKLHSSKYKKSM